MKITSVLIALITGFIIVVVCIPSVLRVARAKNLFDSFNERKVHTGIVPPLGGVAIFIGVVLSTILASYAYTFSSLKYIFASALLMFFIGLKDDLIDISAWKKFVVQVVAALLLVVIGNVRLTSMHGIFTIYQLPYLGSVCISLFLIILVVNAYNLIDGIDGLASGLTILAACTFGILFFRSKHIEYAILSFAIVGSLAGFFIFNVFGGKNKLFMGDTGSLVVGLLLAVLVIQFNEFNIAFSTAFRVNNAPVLAFAIVCIPLIDTLRVMIVRVLQHKSPFSADNNHLHHRLLVLCNKHIHVTLIILAANIFIIGFALLLNSSLLDIEYQLFIIFALVSLLSFIPSSVIRLAKRKQTNKFANQFS